jgi:hypothetical protein
MINNSRLFLLLQLVTIEEILEIVIQEKWELIKDNLVENKYFADLVLEHDSELFHAIQDELEDERLNPSR